MDSIFTVSGKKCPICGNFSVYNAPIFLSIHPYATFHRHSLSYRLNRKQYQSKFLLIAYMLGNILLLLIGIIFSLILISALLFITQRLMGI